jgi:hypothetical protein
MEDMNYFYITTGTVLCILGFVIVAPIFILWMNGGRK